MGLGRHTRMTMLASAAVATIASGARAQSVANVKEIVQVVKTGRAGATTLQDARINQPLGQGDRVRTGGRSGAGLKFPDQSLLRIGELTELVVTSPNRRDARVLHGRIIADYKAPGTISGGYAVAAVRGTEVEYLVDDDKKQAEVRCYHGRVFVGAAANPVKAGTTSQVTGTTLTDPNLVDSEIDWTGAELRFVDGPYNQTVRTVTAFDRQTGVLTFEALPENAGAGRPSGYLLVKDPKRRVVELRNNEGTIVKDGEDPSPARRIPHSQYAGLSRFPYFQSVAETGGVVAPFPGTGFHHEIQEHDVMLLEAIRQLTQIESLHCGGAPIPPPDNTNVLRGPRYGLQNALQTRFAQDAGRSTGGGGAPTQADIRLPRNVRERADGTDTHLEFDIEPFLVAANTQDFAGTRVRARGAHGDVYAEVGYRYAFFGGKLFNGDSHSNVSEAFVEVKGKDGTLTVGRQHVFLGPVHNTSTGALLGLISSDAAMYQLPSKGRYQQTIGYVTDSKAMRPGGFEGGFARGQWYAGRGTLGYNVLGATDRGGIGVTADMSQVAIPKYLDVYGEVGTNHRGKRVTTGGLYFPSIFQKLKLDVFLEYNVREATDERVSLRVRRDLGNGFTGNLFLDDRLGGHQLIGGGAVMWTLKFR